MPPAITATTGGSTPVKLAPASSVKIAASAPALVARASKSCCRSNPLPMDGR
jgi:hypothetical protein